MKIENEKKVYKLIEAHGSEAYESTVNELIEEGYIMAGDLKIEKLTEPNAFFPRESFVYIQVMVKYL